MVTIRLRAKRDGPHFFCGRGSCGVSLDVRLATNGIHFAAGYKQEHDPAVGRKVWVRTAHARKHFAMYRELKNRRPIRATDKPMFSHPGARAQYRVPGHHLQAMVQCPSCGKYQWVP